MEHLGAKLLLAAVALCFIFQLAMCISHESYGILAGYIFVCILAGAGYVVETKEDDEE